MSEPSPAATKSAHPYGSVRSWLTLLGALAILIPIGLRHGPSAVFFSCVTLLEVLALFNILIIVHELGHFWAARWCGMKVEKFAIWFGKPLWSKKIDGVEYILGSIPGGGYVALPQMAPMEALEGPSETPREFLPPVSPWQKIIVAFAGPLFSFLLALFFGCIVWVVGKPVSWGESTTVIGFAVPGNPAAKAGLRSGDKILSIDGHPITHFIGVGDTVIWRIISSTAETIPIVVDRAGTDMTFEVKPERDLDHIPAWYERASPRRIGIGPAQKSLIIKKILPDSPAQVAGLLPKDQITAMNGQILYAAAEIDFWLKDHPNDPITLSVVRNGQTQQVKVTPEKPISPPIPKELPQTSIGVEEWENSVNLIYPTPFQQVQDSAQAVVGTLTALFRPHSSIGASQLSGPIGIINLFFMVLTSDYGWKLALWLAVLINVNLAIMNLFPFPVLDGGHITLALLEWVRRRPLSMSLLEPLQTGCALLLFSFIGYVTFFDVQDSSHMAFTNEEMKFAPKVK